MVYFIEKLNEFLAQEIEQYANCYLFDFDQMIGSYGKRHYNDDVLWIFGHGAAIGDGDFRYDQDRIEPLQMASASYPLKVQHYVRLAWNELQAMHRTLCQIDLVKLVVIDLDDTLWRGVAAERSEFDVYMTEGWPIGFIEALSFLKRRGVLLAIVSKNDENRVTQIWDQIVDSSRLSLDDFAVKKINWRSKAENLEEILREVNVLPRSVVFIDDNPRERDEIKMAYPDIRVFGPNPYLWRRILLWSPETQVVTITLESHARTEMIQAQLERESSRTRMSRADFLTSLDLKVRMFAIDSMNHPSFARAIELINKTNQFNTTGKRWTLQELTSSLGLNTQLFAFTVQDKFTSYGLVGVVIVQHACLVQFVMSCRVVGMDVELAVIAELLSILQESSKIPVTANFTETELNRLCRDLYIRCGFKRLTGSTFEYEGRTPIQRPSHIELRVELMQSALSHPY